MTSRIQRAFQLGGLALARAVLQRRPSLRALNPYSLRPTSETELGHENATAGEAEPYLTTPVRDLTDEQREALQADFYDLVNMTPAGISAWIKDSRLEDVLRRVPGWEWEGIKARNHLRAVRVARWVKPPAQWSAFDYATAQKSVFIIKSLWHRQWLDYPTWVWLRNSGNDWSRPLRSQYAVMGRRPLPRSVAAEAAARRDNTTLSATTAHA